MMRGHDVFSGNAPALVSGAARTGFVIAKATEGRHWNDPRYAAIRAQTYAAGHLFGSYHFAWPGNDPIQEAEHYLAVAQPRPGELLWLDIEKDDGSTWAGRVGYALAWLRHVKARTGASPGWYTYTYYRDRMRQAATTAQWAELNSYPKWPAVYTAPGAVPSSWGLWTMHQWTDNDGGLDGDVFNGDARAWAALAVPGARAGTPLWAALVALAAAGVAVGSVTAGGHTHHPTPPPRPAPAGGTLAQHVPGPPAPAPVPRPACPPAPAPHAPRPAPKPAHRGPAPAHSPTFYVVRHGDTLGAIAARYGTSWPALARLNHITHPNLIYPGQLVRVR